jgi:hypothetical protein
LVLDFGTFLPIIIVGLVAAGFLRYGVRFVLGRIRKRVASEAGLDIDAKQNEVRRGERVDALVTISRSPEELTSVEVGVVCTESYDVEVQTATDSRYGSSTQRETRTAIAHESWLPAEVILGSQSIRIAIPREAPFSYDGDCLSFKWKLRARGSKRHRLDAEAEREICVLP